MAEAVYLLCALTSAGCAVLLLRSYGVRRTQTLLWSGLCFLALAAANAVLFLDLVVWPDVDLSLVRAALNACGTVVLLVALIWSQE